jgi:hypothetical protein
MTQRTIDLYINSTENALKAELAELRKKAEVIQQILDGRNSPAQELYEKHTEANE